MKFFSQVPVLRGLSPSGGFCELVDFNEELSGPIIMLVHGTWARNAEWTRKDSRLCCALRKEWPDAIFCRFHWSGVNGARHRIEASRRLGGEIERVNARVPDRRLIVIAHSHGGNVVAWASANITRPLSEVVYLNTPFIQVLNKEKQSDFLLNLALLGLAAPVFLFLVSLSSLVMSGNPFEISGWIEVLIPGILTMLVVSLLGNLSSITRERLLEIVGKPRRIRRELVLFVVGDEASAGLSGFLFGDIVAKKLIPVALICIVLLFVSLILTGHDPRDSRYFYVAFAVLMTIVMTLLIGGASAFGLLQGLIALDTPTAITPAPIGKVDCSTIAWTENDKTRHSVAH